MIDHNISFFIMFDFSRRSWGMIRIVNDSHIPYGDTFPLNAKGKLLYKYSKRKRRFFPKEESRLDFMKRLEMNGRSINYNDENNDCDDNNQDQKQDQNLDSSSSQNNVIDNKKNEDEQIFDSLLFFNTNFSSGDYQDYQDDKDDFLTAFYTSDGNE